MNLLKLFKLLVFILFLASGNYVSAVIYITIEILFKFIRYQGAKKIFKQSIESLNELEPEVEMHLQELVDQIRIKENLKIKGHIEIIDRLIFFHPLFQITLKDISRLYTVSYIEIDNENIELNIEF